MRAYKGLGYGRYIRICVRITVDSRAYMGLDYGRYITICRFGLRWILEPICVLVTIVGIEYSGLNHCILKSIESELRQIYQNILF